MAPWRNLNLMGRVLVIACILNVICAVILLRANDYMCIFSTIMAAVCGLSTYQKKYQTQTAEDINERREE